MLFATVDFLSQTPRGVGYTIRMSILRRSTYFALSALLTLAVACGGDDDAPADDGDDDDGGTTIDAGDGGDDDDGGDDGDDDGGADAAPGVDAAPSGGGPLGGSFLLSLEVTSALGTGTVVRTVAAVNHTPDEEGGIAGTADFVIQALFAQGCNAKMSGQPAGTPIAVSDVAVDAKGAFTFTAADITLPMGAVDAEGLPTCGADLMAASLTATGTAVGEENEACGTAVVEALGGIEASFGSVRLEEPVQFGDANLPAPVTACAK